MVRPIEEAHGWDHESGIEGFSVDKAFVLRNAVPGNMSGQITKDKKDSNIGFEGEMSIPHSRNLITTSGFDIQARGFLTTYTSPTLNLLLLLLLYLPRVFMSVIEKKHSTDAESPPPPPPPPIYSAYLYEHLHWRLVMLRSRWSACSQ